MTLQETMKALALIQECYPHFMDGRTPETTANIWARMFPSEEYAKVEAAVMAFVASDVKGYPPAIGQIKEKLAQMEADNTLDEAGAWSLVAAAMRNGIYGSEKEFRNLPADIQRSVGSANQLREWSLMDTETVNSVVCSNFMRSYRARAGHVREMQKLPEPVRRMYGEIGDAFSIDRALPASQDEVNQPDPEPSQCPEAIHEIAAELRKKVDAERVESVKKQVAAILKNFGIHTGGDAHG